MPRAAVYGDDPVFEVDQEKRLSAEDYDNERSIAEVRWNRESEYVQIVTRLKGYEVGLPESEDAYKYGMYVTLNRASINDLIRNLRRARDQAFGRDE